MHVHFQLDQLPAFRSPAITIGTFDGVHGGHYAILELLKQEAARFEGETVVITFHPHPRRILNNLDAPALLTSLEERIERFQSLGIHHLVVVPFDPQFAELTAQAYVHEFLVKLFRPKVIVIGYDHRFGKDRTGDYAMLEKMGTELDFEVKELDEQLLNASRISSTHIRHALLQGDILQANQLLGYPYELRGVVITGDKLGRTLGFPTANLSLVDSDKLIPGSGVYAVKIELFRNTIVTHEIGMMNIGYRPTVNGKERRIEVHIFNFDDDIYGEILKVTLIKYTRKELKFSGLEALKEQLKLDKLTISEFFNGLNP
ncbi:MAG: bifunctional riboflavin kinase/FAD synthetase [Bacteroidetes bacterium]|nr:bifunctional riboflavin kinase/FAD synthetase [Bacteroidota bacterium]